MCCRHPQSLKASFAVARSANLVTKVLSKKRKKHWGGQSNRLLKGHGLKPSPRKKLLMQARSNQTATVLSRHLAPGTTPKQRPPHYQSTVHLIVFDCISIVYICLLDLSISFKIIKGSLVEKRPIYGPSLKSPQQESKRKQKKRNVSCLLLTHVGVFLGCFASQGCSAQCSGLCTRFAVVLVGGLVVWCCDVNAVDAVDVLVVVLVVVIGIVNTRKVSTNCEHTNSFLKLSFSPWNYPLARLGTSHMVLWSCGFRKGWASFEILRPWAPKLTWAGCSCPQVLEHQATPRYQWLQLRFQHHLSLYLHFLFFQARSTRQQTFSGDSKTPRVAMFRSKWSFGSLERNSRTPRFSSSIFAARVRWFWLCGLGETKIQLLWSIMGIKSCTR